MPVATITVKSEAVAAIVPWTLDVLCRDELERRGELTTERAESSHGLPVVVVGGVAYGPGDLGPHTVVIYGSDEDRRAAQLAGYTVAES